MATVTGSAGGQPVTFTNSSQSVAQVAQSILAATTTAPITGGASTLTGSFFSTAGTAPTTVVGGTGVSVGVLTGQNALFQTGVSQASQVVASDFSSSTIVNNNANGSLIAFTGAGGNALSGGGVVNAFQTGAGGQDAVAFSNSGQPNQINVLTAQGQDTVNVFGAGPGANQVNFITAASGGSADVTLNNGASLTFANLSNTTSTITASTGSTVSTAGNGNALIIDAGTGSQTFNVGVGAGSGNVTLVGSAGGGVDTYNFDKIGTGLSSNVDVVANFTTADTVHLVGYEAGAYTANVVNGSTVLTLSDNTQIVFAGVSNASQVTSRIG